MRPGGTTVPAATCPPASTTDPSEITDPAPIWHLKNPNNYKCGNHMAFSAARGKVCQLRLQMNQLWLPRCSGTCGSCTRAEGSLVIADTIFDFFFLSLLFFFPCFRVFCFFSCFPFCSVFSFPSLFVVSCFSLPLCVCLLFVLFLFSFPFSVSNSLIFLIYRVPPSPMCE